METREEERGEGIDEERKWESKRKKGESVKKEE